MKKVSEFLSVNFQGFLWEIFNIFEYARFCNDIKSSIQVVKRMCIHFDKKENHDHCIFLFRTFWTLVIQSQFIYPKD